MKISFISSAIAHLYYSVVPSLMIYRLYSILQVSVKEDPVKESDCSETMVGQTSKNVETDRAGGSVGSNAAYLCTSNWHPTTETVCCTTDTAVTMTTASPSPSIKTEVEVKQESELTQDMETLYGTYDMATNSIMIIYPNEENDMAIQECVQEVDSLNIAADPANPSNFQSLDYMTQFSLAHTDTMDTINDMHSDSVSKLDYSNQSDAGYESHGSPSSQSNDLTDLWHESFTELFPTLA